MRCRLCQLDVFSQNVNRRISHLEHADTGLDTLSNGLWEKLLRGIVKMPFSGRQSAPQRWQPRGRHASAFRKPALMLDRFALPVEARPAAAAKSRPFAEV